MLREDIRGICHRPCICNDKDKCDMWDQLSVPDETEEWNALPSQKMIMTSSSYGKGEWLVSLIGNLLISWRNKYEHRRYN